MQAPELKLQPIEQTVPELFEVAGVTYFEPDQARRAIRQYPGLVPVAITPEPRVVWLMWAITALRNGNSVMVSATYWIIRG